MFLDTTEICVRAPGQSALTTVVCKMPAAPLSGERVARQVSGK